MPAQPTAAEVVTATYFQPLQGYFWRWAEENTVVEWVDGTTITYRSELADLLTGLAPDGLPQLGTVLLLLAACNDAWGSSSAEIGLLQGLATSLLRGLPGAERLSFHIRVAASFLDIVRELPPALRQGPAKAHLLREVLGRDSLLLPPVAARQVAQQLRQPAAAEALNPTLFAPGAPLSVLRFRRDLLAFDEAAQKFPTVHSLELRLRTGLDQLPAPLPEPPLPPPATEAPPADLLAELAKDAQTASLARLVPHLRAALHLPQPARQAGSQPLGGVADLTNRGPLDRLLLSELAQDDLSLLARLAHGEALYLRREAPPLPQPPPRVLLLDTTLQMWGLPRVAGLAAALALALPATTGASLPPALAFALGSHAAQPLDLRTRPGIVAALGHLDVALHCGAALPALLATLPAQAEAVLITEAQVARLPAFGAQLREAPPALRFLLTVARGGELALYELAGGTRTLLSSSQVDWERALFPPPGEARRPGQSQEAVRLPAFMQLTAPLLFPTLHVVPSVATMLYSEQLGALGLDKHCRLLYWEKPTLGARELLPLVEKGEYCFGFGTASSSIAYLLVSQLAAGRAPGLILYKLNLLLAEVHRTDLSEQLEPHFNWVNTQYVEGSFILQKAADNLDLIIGCRKGTVRTRPHYGAAPLPDLPLALPTHRFLNPGYSVLQRISRIGISNLGLLTIENRQLVAGEYDFSLNTFKHDTIKYPATNTGSVAHLTANAGLRCQHFVWPDGSEAVADGRGLLHLRSANPALPEVTLVVAIDLPTAAWATDGTLCGNPYFTGRSIEEALRATDTPVTATDFYERYIQPFIDHLR